MEFIFYILFCGIVSICSYAYTYAKTDNKEISEEVLYTSFLFAPLIVIGGVLMILIELPPTIINKLLDKTVHKQKRLQEKYEELQKEIEELEKKDF